MKPAHRATRISAALTRLAHGDAGAGMLLLVTALAALALANSPWAHGYHALFHSALAWTPVAKLTTLELWINDALMAVFFFVVGLEIKREVLDGDLSTPPRRRLPVMAAAMGMAVPAAIYLAVAGGTAGLARGWAIPAATDIAFAVGVLALAGRGLPPSLRLFLLTVAIVDDLGAVAIIALAYTPALQLGWLGLAAAAWSVMALLGAMRHPFAMTYAVLGLVLWFAVLHSGVHATVAGVFAAFTIPLAPARRSGDSLLLRMEHALTPWSAYLIVPVFGFANAGVALAGASLNTPLPWAVAAGLFVGKQVGVLGAIALARAARLAAPPLGATWTQLWGVGLLCGIGFTMSLFITGLAFPGAPEVIEEAKLGILAGSALSGVLGFAVLRLARR